MEFWPEGVFGILPFFALWTGVKLYLGHPLVPFGLILMSLWCSLITIGIINTGLVINEIRKETNVETR